MEITLDDCPREIESDDAPLDAYEDIDESGIPYVPSDSAAADDLAEYLGPQR